MKISARNILSGRVTRIIEGALNCEVVLEIAPGVEKSYRLFGKGRFFFGYLCTDITPYLAS